MLKKNSKLIFKIILGSLIILLIAWHAWPYFSINFQWRESKGEILVDEPKIYTRERLVNDRFTEEAWLQEQLKNTNAADFRAPQAKISNTSSQQSDLTLKAAKSDGNATKPDQPSNTPLQSDAAALEKAHTDIAPSPIDTFSEMLDYRDKIRNELMRIQLDDRHDIEGNTLYRLNFDTAIIPGANTHSAAKIQVTISPSKDDYKGVFEEWNKQMQTMMDSLITDKVTTFKHAAKNFQRDANSEENFLATDQIEFERFLRDEVCSEVKSLSEEFSDQNSPKPEFRCPDTTQTSKQLAYDDCDKHEDYFFCEVEKLIGSYLMNFELANHNRTAQESFDELKEKYPKLSPKQVNELSNSLSSYCSEKLEKPSLPNNDNIFFRYNKVGTLSISTIQELSEEDKKILKKQSNPTWQPVSCPKLQLSQPRLMIVMGLLEQLQGLKANKDKNKELIRTLATSAASTIPYSKAIETYYPKAIEKLIRPYFCINESNKDNSRIHKQDPINEIDQPLCKSEPINQSIHRLINRMTFSDKNTVISEEPQNLNYLMVKYHEKKFRNSLSKYFTFTLEGCDMQQCRLILGQAPNGIQQLKNDLNQVEQTFSYSITPQMQTQRIALLNKQKNQLQALINATLLTNGTNAEGLIKHFTELEKELEIMERHPMVVGFGDWQNAEKIGEPNKITSFGWVIKPRLTAVSGGLFGNPDFRQVSDHYSLSAVISIPSWWRKVDVKIEKCWLSPSLYSDSDAISSGCNNPSNWPFLIKVPGKTQDINKKLEIEVIKTPFLTAANNEGIQILEVGREAVVRLEGERLWRSTVVMLDNQKADSIEVLPDMQAVLAKFKCLRPSSGQEQMEHYIYDHGGLPIKSDCTISVKTEGKPSVKGTPAKTNEEVTCDFESKKLPESSTHPEQAESQNSIKPTGSLTQLWTSEGKAKPLPVILKPFVQRYVGEAPCYVNQNLVKAAQDSNAIKTEENTNKTKQ